MTSIYAPFVKACRAHAASDAAKEGAWDAGYNAHKRGEPRGSNPNEGDLAEAWNRGWDAFSSREEEAWGDDM